MQLAKDLLACIIVGIASELHVPFHRVQTWNGRFFQELDLLTRNLTMDLTHYPSDCPSIPLYDDTEMMNDLDDSDKADESKPRLSAGGYQYTT